MTDAEIGEKLIALIGHSKLIQYVTTLGPDGQYRKEPNPVVYVWRANAIDQLGAAAREYVNNVTPVDLDFLDTETLLKAIERRHKWIVSVRQDFNDEVRMHWAGFKGELAQKISDAVIKVLSEYQK
jgi:hypothetical protein